MERRGSSCTAAHGNTAGETIKHLRPSFTDDSAFSVLLLSFFFFYRSCLSRFGLANKSEQKNEPQSRSKCGDISDREHNALQQGPII